MEAKYIVAISALSVFCVLFIIFFILLAHRRKMEAKLQAWLQEVYSDKNLIKMDYNTSALDDKGGSLVEKRNSQSLKYEQQEDSEEQLKIEEAFVKKEIEGIEEITGNYIPD